jgi:hypothetical protein
VNEQPTPESFLNLTLTQHPHDENPELREMRTRFLKLIPLKLGTIPFLQTLAR